MQAELSYSAKVVEALFLEGRKEKMKNAPRSSP
jgi:hypothetical protein